MTALAIVPAAGYPPPPDLTGAACRKVDAELMFPAPGDRAGVRMAIAVCAPCPVRAACRAYALAWPGPMAGVWGGLSPASIDLAKRTANSDRRATSCRK